jgi:O-antigen/teichoic acid export membrane protein
MPWLQFFVNEIVAVFKDSGILFTATVVGSLVLFLANIGLARLFDPANFGSFKIVLNLALFIPAVLELGAGVTLVKYLAEFSSKHQGNAKYLINFFVRMRIITFILVIVTLFVFRQFFSVLFFNDASFDLLMIAGLVVVAAGFFDIYRYVIIGSQNFKLLAISGLVGYISIGLFTFFFGLFGGIFWALVGWGIGTMVGSIPMFLFTMNLNKGVKEKKFQMGKIFWEYSMPLYLMIIPNFLGIAVIPILSLFYPPVLIGYYSFAFIFFNGFILLPNALYQVLFPKFAMLHGDNKHHEVDNILKKTLLVYAGISIIGLLGTIFFAGTLIGLLAPKYLPGTIVFQIVMLSCFLVGFVRIFQTYYTAVNRIWAVTLTVVLQNFIIVVAGFIALSLVA